MSMPSIHFAYKHIDGASGGANNFIRSLVRTLESGTEWRVEQDLRAEYDILFLNQLGRGPGNATRTGDTSIGKYYSIAELQQVIAAKHRRPAVVVRAVNLRSHAFEFTWRDMINPMTLRKLWYSRTVDRNTLSALAMADHVIFQSAYQLEFFRAAGYHGSSHTVVHNGANMEFRSDIRRPAPNVPVIKLVAAVNTGRATKRHDLIAAVAAVPGVEVHCFGNWPAGVPSGKAILRGKVSRETLIEEYRTAHFFLHPAVKDPCPNAIMEALFNRLPVLYNPGPGSSRELVGSCGSPLDEKNLEGSIRTAVGLYEQFQDAIAAKAEYFSGARASEQYREVFRSIIERRGV